MKVSVGLVLPEVLPMGLGTATFLLCPLASVCILMSKSPLLIRTIVRLD